MNSEVHPLLALTKYDTLRNLTLDEMNKALPRMTAAEAAQLIENGQTVAFSGFTPAGAPKDTPFAIAQRAKALHAEGKPFKINMFTGASTGKSLDGAPG